MAGRFGELVEAGACFLDPGLADAMQALGQTIEVHGDLAAVGDGKLAGLAGRQCPAVGGQVGEGHVDLVPDGRDDRQA